MKLRFDPAQDAGARMHCVCCALPSHLLRHLAGKAGEGQGQLLVRHDRASVQIRSARGALMARSPHTRGKASAPRSIYDAGGGQRLPGQLVRSEGSRATSDAAVNAAYGNVGITLRFYEKVFGRRSLDGRGMPVVSSVHYGDRFSNAMWTGRQMLFGDGDGVHILGFAHCLDIVAHELTHAVIQHCIEGGLGEQHRGGKVRLTGQAGALNESFCDVFSSMVKQWHDGQDVRAASWLVGEGILAPSLGRAVRSLKDPGNPARTYEADNQAKDMSGYVEGGDVHANSGIPNHAFYLAARTIGGNSWERAGRIWYAALHQLKPRATFADAAAVTTEMAGTLFGKSSRERRAVSNAWRQVQVAP